MFTVTVKRNGQTNVSKMSEDHIIEYFVLLSTDDLTTLANLPVGDSVTIKTRKNEEITFLRTAPTEC